MGEKLSLYFNCYDVMITTFESIFLSDMLNCSTTLVASFKGIDTVKISKDESGLW